jgi:RND family efflux transporter MFP subunit
VLGNSSRGHDRHYSIRFRVGSRVTLALVIAGVLVAAGCGKGDAGAQPEKAKEGPKQVKLVAVEQRSLERTIEISGNLAADELVVVAVKVPGRLASVNVDLASPVKEGDVVARVEETDYRLRVDQAQAAVAQARVQLGLTPEGTDDAVETDSTALVKQAQATHEESRLALARAQSLAQEGLTTGAQLDAAQATFLRAETSVQAAREEIRQRQATLRQRRSELRQAQQQLADTVIRAPINGVVQARRANTGEFVAAGAPIADVVRIDPLRLKLAIPERDAASVKTGHLVHLQVDGDPKVYDGTLARIAPALDQQNRTLQVEADIKNPGTLRPGVLARARIVVGSSPALTLPQSSIVVFAGLSKVITVADGKAVEKQVTTGKRSGDFVEVLSGVIAGDKVVEKPGSLQQGQPVRVIAG